MALVIAPLGAVSVLADDRAGDATWNEGCIRIHSGARSVTVSVDFDRLTGPAIAAALYELGDMEPERICLAIDEDTIIEVLIGFESAARRLCEIFADTDITEECSDAPWLPGGGIHYCEIKHQSGCGAGVHAERTQSCDSARTLGRGPLSKRYGAKWGKARCVSC